MGLVGEVALYRSRGGETYAAIITADAGRRYSEDLACYARHAHLHVFLPPGGTPDYLDGTGTPECSDADHPGAIQCEGTWRLRSEGS